MSAMPNDLVHTKMSAVQNVLVHINMYALTKVYICRYRLNIFVSNSIILSLIPNQRSAVPVLVDKSHAKLKSVANCHHAENHISNVKTFRSL